MNHWKVLRLLSGSLREQNVQLYPIELSVKSGDQGPRTSSFRIIIGHRTGILGMKILQNEITGTQTSFSTNFGGKLSFILCFLFPDRLHCTAATYIFTAPTCTTTIITLKPCSLNAEFQYFIARFNKNFLTLQIPLKEGLEGETEHDFTDNSNIRNFGRISLYLYGPENQGPGQINSAEQSPFLVLLG